MVDSLAATMGATDDAEGQGRGAVIGERYEVLGLLGAGAMGNVYRALDRQLDEVVAIKMLLPRLAGSRPAVDRFRRELKLARRVTHANVARVFDLSEVAGEYVLSMEYIEGESLGSLLRRERALPESRAVEIGRAICAGVAAAHAAGVLHRDLKPDNVLLARDGRVLVADFGIASVLCDGAGRRTGGVVGTPLYMAPEQIDERASVDHRADVYAFGTMLYEMLTGETAWKGDSIWALAAARLTQAPPDPRARRPDVTPALADVTLRCMAREPPSRFGAMAEVEAALAALSLASNSSAGSFAAPSGSPGSPGSPGSSRTHLSRQAPARAGDDMPMTTGTDKRVAVLPFANMGSADQQYVADGLTEDLIDSLTAARGLRVRSRGSVMRYQGATVDAREVGRELGVHVVVEGSIRRSPTGYRIATRLVSVSDGFQLWAQRFDVSEGELLSQNDVIARTIAGVLTADLEGPARPPAPPAVVDLYLRAKHAYHRTFSSGSTEMLGLFDQLLALAPDDPRALAGWAKAHAHQIFWTASERQAVYDAAERAVQLGPMLPEAHHARASVHQCDLDFEGAMPSLREALRLSPTHAEVHEAIGHMLFEAGEPSAMRHIDMSLALDPGCEFPYILRFFDYELQGDHEGADAFLDSMRAQGNLAAHQLEIRTVLWRREFHRAAQLLAASDPSSPQYGLVLMLLGPLVSGVRPPPGPPPVPPGMLPPRFILRVFFEIAVEIACAFDDLPGAAATLEQMDALGIWSHRWLEQCGLLSGLRELPSVAPIRQRARSFAAGISAAWRASAPSLPRP
jgi:eukaryotic-like serine/threonine-protein kinase